MTALLRYGALAGALGYVGLVDPHDPRSVFPLCPFKLLTGWDCPACGGLRMTHDLLHGDVFTAATDNAFLVGGMPMLTAWVLLRRYRGRRLLPIPSVVTIAVLAIVWTVLRNATGLVAVPLPTLRAG